MIPSIVLFSSVLKKNGQASSKNSKKEKARPKKKTEFPRFFIPLLGFSVICGFLVLAFEISKTEPIFFPKAEQVLSFKEFLPSPKPYPINRNALPIPSLSAKSVIVIDADSAVVLYQKDPDLRLSPASTTKMMTALIVLANYPLEQVLTVGDSKVEGNSIKLIFGEQMTVKNLLYGLLVGSSNDAAQVLAENFPGGETGFVVAMNQKILELGLENTHFTNPVGLDAESHYSTARDLAKLATAVIKEPDLATIVSTPEITIADVSGKIQHKLKNTDELIGKIDGVRGIKTGWTQNAGECLVSWVEKEGRKIIIVVLGSQNRFGETQALIDWVFGNFEWKTISP